MPQNSDDSPSVAEPLINPSPSPDTFVGSSHAFFAWRAHLQKVIDHCGTDDTAANEGKVTNSKATEPLPLSIRAKLALLLSEENAFLGATDAAHIQHQQRYCTDLLKEIPQLAEKLAAAEGLSDDTRRRFERYAINLIPEAWIPKQLKKESDTAKTAPPKGRLNERIKVAYGPSLTKDIIVSWATNPDKTPTQASLYRLARRMRHVRSMRFHETVNADERPHYYPDLQYLQPISEADFDIARACRNPFDLKELYRFAAKIGFLHKAPPDYEFTGKSRWHIRYDPTFPAIFMRAWRPGSECDDVFSGLDDEPYCIAVDHLALLKNIDQHLYYPPRADHAHYVSAITAESLIQKLKGVYSVYYPCILPDGTTGYFRATMRISYALIHEPTRYTVSDNKAIRVLRCKLNVPRVIGTGTFATSFDEARADSIDVPEDTPKPANAQTSPPESLAGVNRYQYRGRLTPVGNHDHFFLDFALETDAYEGRPLSTDDGNRLPLLPDAFRIVMGLPQGGTGGNDNIVTGMITSINQRSELHLANGKEHRQIYSSKAIIVKQDFSNLPWIQSHREVQFMRHQPRFFPSLKAAEADGWHVTRGIPSKPYQEFTYALKGRKSLFKPDLALIESLQEIQEFLEQASTKEEIATARSQLKTTLEQLEDFHRYNPVGTIFL